MWFWSTELRFESLGENMEKLLVKFFKNEPLTADEAKAMLKEYARLVGKDANDIIEKMFAHSNPIAHQMILSALNVSANYLTQHYTVTKVFSKEGNLLMVY